MEVHDGAPAYFGRSFQQRAEFCDRVERYISEQFKELLDFSSVSPAPEPVSREALHRSSDQREVIMIPDEPNKDVKAFPMKQKQLLAGRILKQP